MRRRQTGEIDPMSFGGRYTLLRRLAIGGMAEIYLARQAAMAGFEKDIVIKRLRTELADDPRIVEMFLDEAKIGAQLNHPNIVHVYDVDQFDGIPYIAMEYIIGEELNELCRRGITHDRFLPIEHAVELVRQAAAGMGYFHAKRGAEGSMLANEPLDIVHLDISPSNLLVTQDGFLKIIDFGIARARGQHTRQDVLPGKLSYMSPEQASREQVDHRSDVFSLGIVLYEITVGRRLFRGQAQEVVPRLITAQVEPPTFARRNFPPALESIVMRALEKHPEDRYQSAYDLADDLESFLRDEKLHSGPVRIARYLDMLTMAAGGARRPELISEAEAHRDTIDELDFDRSLFDGYAPSEGAPGPDQAPLWEDVEQPEAEIAAALNLELAELRALRTPVPTRPSGMMPVRGDSPLLPAEAEEEAGSTNPVPRMQTDEIEAPDEPTAIDAEILGKAAQAPRPSLPLPPAAADSAPAVPGIRLASLGIPDEDPGPRCFATIDLLGHPTPEPRPVIAQRTHSPRSVQSVPLTAVSPRSAASVRPGPAVGAAFLARSTPPRLPWLLVAMLGVAVLALVAYIVMK